MASITIRGLEDRIKHGLRVRAARNGRSMEEEARLILREALRSVAPDPISLYDAIRQKIEALDGFDLDIPRRDQLPDPPKFE
jgi:plasmid stability protein